jgi:hypothetical protein
MEIQRKYLFLDFLRDSSQIPSFSLLLPSLTVHPHRHRGIRINPISAPWIQAQIFMGFLNGFEGIPENIKTRKEPLIILK